MQNRAHIFLFYIPSQQWLDTSKHISEFGTGRGKASLPSVTGAFTASPIPAAYLSLADEELNTMYNKNHIYISWKTDWVVNLLFCCGLYNEDYYVWKHCLQLFNFISLEEQYHLALRLYFRTLFRTANQSEPVVTQWLSTKRK